MPNENEPAGLLIEWGQFMKTWNGLQMPNGPAPLSVRAGRLLKENVTDDWLDYRESSLSATCRPYVLHEERPVWVDSEILLLLKLSIALFE